MIKNKKNCIKFFLGMIVGVLLTTTTVSAAILYQASQITFDDTKSDLGANNLQTAIAELHDYMIDMVGMWGEYGIFKINYLADDNATIIQTYTYNEGSNSFTWEEFVNSTYNYTQNNNPSISIVDGYAFHNPTGTYIRVPNGSGYDLQSATDTILYDGDIYVTSQDLCCFDPDTLITIDLEGNTKKIKDIEVGDTIVVENVNTKEKYLTTVLKDASEHPETFDFTEITLEDGTQLRFNSYHPIYTTEGYKSVTNYNDYPTLEEGDYVVDSNNNKKKITKIHKYMTSKGEMTYNLLIKGIEEFYLEEEYAYIANNTLVHTGIAEYDDEDEWREKNRYKCTQQDSYKDFNYDKATDEELIKYLVELKVSNENAFNEYIKYYISADQYYRYTKLARIIKSKAEELSNIDTLHYIRKNNKLNIK